MQGQLLTWCEFNMQKSDENRFAAKAQSLRDLYQLLCVNTALRIGIEKSQSKEKWTIFKISANTVNVE